MQRTVKRAFHPYVAKYFNFKSAGTRIWLGSTSVRVCRWRFRTTFGGIGWRSTATAPNARELPSIAFNIQLESATWSILQLLCAQLNVVHNCTCTRCFKYAFFIKKSALRMSADRASAATTDSRRFKTFSTHSRRSVRFRNFPVLKSYLTIAKHWLLHSYYITELKIINNINNSCDEEHAKRCSIRVTVGLNLGSYHL